MLSASLILALCLTVPGADPQGEQVLSTATHHFTHLGIEITEIKILDPATGLITRKAIGPDGSPVDFDALLKAHTALVGLRRFVERHPGPAASAILADVDPLLADTHAFEELRLLSQLRSRPTTFTDDEMASLRRILGGSGIDAGDRLGLRESDPGDGPRAAFAAAQRWRRRAEHPLNDPFTTRSCRAAVRSAEALVAQYAGYRPGS